ncbi:MAG: peptidoglycan-binding protein [Actinobacteria bacterium]|nr:peptidoglycan-binding protein [Actinomycetota bacterium]
MNLPRILPAAVALAMTLGLIQASVASTSAIAAPELSDSSKKTFLTSLVGPAQQAQQATGVPASALIAQAIVESQWGTSDLSSSKNVFNTRCSAGASAAEYASLANKQVGKPYVLGQPVPYNAPSPKSFDCSGLIIWLNNQTRSFTMGDDTAAGLYNRTKAVSGEPAVGDMVFLKNNPARSNGIGHVAVLTAKLSNGDWRIIEAKGKAYGVVKTTLSYWKTRKYYTGVRRLAAINFVGITGVTYAAQASSQSNGCTVVGTGSKAVKYRTYSSLTKAFGDRASLIASEAAYQAARAASGNVTTFVDALAAVDSPSKPADYAAQLKALIKTWNLSSYDVAPTSLSLVMTTSTNSTGSKVSALQSLLNQAGQKITVNGSYDAKTKDAVKAFQKAKGLGADGEAGPLTLTALFGGLTLKSGSSGHPVTALHALLQGAGYPVDSGSSLGSATLASVKKFQTAAGLTSNGTVDATTWARLFMLLGPSPVPTITGDPVVGSQLKATAGTWGPGKVELAYQWYRDGKAISKATAATYQVTEADAKASLTVAVKGTRMPYVSVTRTSAAVALLPKLTATPKPTIAGKAAVGETLTAKPGTWEPKPVTPSYQWYRGSKAIDGATQATYAIQEADGGATLAVAVTGTKDGHAPATVTSDATAKVPALTLTATPKPTVSGTLEVGKTLTAKPGTWEPNPVTLGYQWYRGSKAIKGATKATYKLQQDDIGKTLTVKVTGTRAGYASVTTASAASKPVPKRAFTATPVPKIKGTARVGLTLKVTKGTWKPTKISFSYRWYRDGKAISGATKSSYKLAKKDTGALITVKVTGKKSGYTTTAMTSKATTEVAPARKLTKAPTPTISGSAKVGSKLKVKAGSWAPKGVKLTYRWYRNGKAISKATKSSYKLVKKDSKAVITVKVTGKKAGYVTVTMASKPTAKVKS